MALMGVNIDKRTLSAIYSNFSSVYAHGLPAAPDVVLVRMIVNSNATMGITLQPMLVIPVDANNVTISNLGSGTYSNMEVCAIRFHSFLW